MESATARNNPKDAETMMNILKEMGVNEYEPKVVDLMLEFAYRYVSDVLNDAKVYSGHANKKSLDIEDVKLAVQFRMDHSFTTPPPRELLLELARHKNSQPLPPIKPYSGLNLPPERYCLYGSHYKLKSQKKPSVLGHRGTVLTMGAIRPSVSGTVIGGSLIRPSGSASVSLLVRGAVPNKPQLVPKQTMSAISLSSQSDIHLNQTSQESIATTVSQPSDSLKRKREDDDYDAF